MGKPNAPLNTPKGVDSTGVTFMVVAMVTTVHAGCSGEAGMFRRQLYLHYRLVREAITALIVVGSALVASYLVLKAGL